MADVTRSIVFNVATRVRGYGSYAAGDQARVDVATATELVNRGAASWRDVRPIVPSLSEFTVMSIEGLEEILEEVRDRTGPPIIGES